MTEHLNVADSFTIYQQYIEIYKLAMARRARRVDHNSTLQYIVEQGVIVRLVPTLGTGSFLFGLAGISLHNIYVVKLLLRLSELHMAQ